MTGCHTDKMDMIMLENNIQFGYSLFHQLLTIVFR